jgi:hypothetical protein
MKGIRGDYLPMFRRWNLEEWHTISEKIILNASAPEKMGFEYWDCPTPELVSLLNTIVNLLGKIVENGRMEFSSTSVGLAYHSERRRITIYFLHEESKTLLYKMWVEAQGISILEPRYDISGEDRVVGWRLRVATGSEENALHFLNVFDREKNRIYTISAADQPSLTLLENNLIVPFFGDLVSRRKPVEETKLVAFIQAVQTTAIALRPSMPEEGLRGAIAKNYHTSKVTPERIKTLGLTYDLISLSPSELFSLLSYWGTALTNEERREFVEEDFLANVLREIHDRFQTLKPDSPAD